MALCFGVLLAAPMTAGAATLQTVDGVLVYTAGDSEHNNIEFRKQQQSESTPASIQVIETGSAYHEDGSSDELDAISIQVIGFPETRCAGSGGTVYCQTEGITAVKALLRDGNDSFAISPELNMPITVDGGPATTASPAAPSPT